MPRKKIDRPSSGAGDLIDVKTGLPMQKPVLPRICEREKYYRESRGMEQKTLAEKIGVTKNTISNWEQGKSRPDINLLPALCQALGITVYELLDMEDPSPVYTAAEKKLLHQYRQLSDGHRHVIDKLADSLLLVERAENRPAITKRIFFDKPLAAGVGDPTEQEDRGTPIYLYSSPTVEIADCVFAINGESMEPDFHDGDKVLVQRIRTGSDLQFGEVGAFMVGNETYIKVYEEDGLHSLNPVFPTMRFEDEEAVYLIGRVLGVIEDDQLPGDDEIEQYQSAYGKL